MSDTPTPQPVSDTDAQVVKTPNTLIYCMVPNGGTIVTTITHCHNIGGTNTGKYVPPSAVHFAAPAEVAQSSDPS